MSRLIKLNPEESIAAVKWQGKWRFFYDIDIMFLLDYTKYDDSIPEEGDFRYGTLVVNESNIELWMDSIHGELTTEQIPYARWDDDEQVQLTFVIDFDVKMWIGYHWQNDQSAYQDYQPEGWIAIEDDCFNYLPIDIAKLWDVQLEVDSLIVLINDQWFPLTNRRTRVGWWGEVRRSIKTAINLEIIRIFEISSVKTRETVCKYMIANSEWVDVRVSYNIQYNRDINLRIDLQRDGYVLRHVDTINIKASR